MKRNYDTEIAELPSTYSSVLTSDAHHQVAAAVLAARPMIFVGSGGALAAARLAADLHTRSTGELGVAMTPLEAASAPASSDVGLVLFSARGRHPDASLVMNAARARGADHLGVVSCRPREDLPEPLAAGDVRVASVPSPPDGFLATNSLIAMTTALSLAHAAVLPDELPSFDLGASRALRRECLVLTGPGSAAVGVDLEARLAETGLATVQLADYRNLAHGRHVGLARRLEDVSVIATVEPSYSSIADRTLALLPSGVDLFCLTSPLPWPASVLDLFVQSIQVVGATGADRKVDPGRPGVQSFGRRLYHLPIARDLAKPVADPVARKLAAGGLDASSRDGLQLAYDEWIADLRSQVIGGVVLDYDGTCCETWDRYRPPHTNVQAQILRLLEQGVVVAFASGRGRSLLDDTRSWLPESLWPQVTVGLYNGTVVMTLADEPPLASDPEGPLSIVADRLEHAVLKESLVVERRGTQISVTSKSGRATGVQLLPMVQALVARPPAQPVTAVASGHSVDVMPSEGGKVTVLQAVESMTSGAVLAIGDQGQVGGNDFDLLASRSTTLSVDRCSADPTRCWNIDRRSRRGPELLVRYLKSIQSSQSSVRFDWREK